MWKTEKTLCVCVPFIILLSLNITVREPSGVDNHGNSFAVRVHQKLAQRWFFQWKKHSKNSAERMEACA